MRKRLLWLMLLALSNMAYAQPAGTQNPTKLDFNIPTPNTAAFNKYGNIPVNLFSGLPNISVPIYTVNAGKHTLPIGLSYHAAGIKVSDLSSDVGLGWSLNSAYTISRVLRGKPDERGYESQQGASLIAKASPFLSVNSTIDTFKAVADGIWDTQPDEFNFNIGSASGKFIIGNDGIITMPDQDVKVSYTKTPVEHDFVFVLTDAQGVRYYFNDYSTTSSESCSDFGGTMDYASTWYVSKIIYPDTKDSLTFNYTTELQAITTISETRNYDYGDINPYPVKSSVCSSTVHVFEKKLNRIVFPNGRVNFNYNTEKYEVAGTQALSNNEVYDNGSNLVRKFNLGYTYYNDISTDPMAKKLRLDSVYTSVGSELIDRYNFGYDDNSIPAYGSFSQDHWGYYNGYSNSTLIEGKTFTDGTTTFDVIGGNRDVNPLHTRRGILNRIYHPTGGYTYFEYENNTVGKDCGENNYLAEPIYSYTKYTAFSSCKYNSATQYQNATTTFTAPSTQTVTIQVERNTWTCVGNTKNFILKDLTTNQVVAQGVNNVNYQFIAGHNYNLYVEADCRYAEANMYDCEDRIRASVTFQNIVGYDKNKFVGGLRVKRITDYDPYSAVSNVRTYDYSLPGEPDRSSGIAQMKPNYESNYRYRFTRPNGTSGYDLIDITSYVFSSLANNTAQNNSSPVAYSYVRETYGANGEGGSILYNFSTPYHKCEINYPFAPATSYAHRNGQLLTAQTFDKNNVLLRKVENIYSYQLGGSVNGWKTAYSVNKANTEVKEVYKFRGELYSYLGEKVRLVKSTTTDLTATGSLITTTYQNHLGSSNHYPYQTLTRQPDGAQVEQTTYLSSDYNTSALTSPFRAPLALKYMSENHLTAYPVETFTKVDGKVVSGSLTEYELNEFQGYKVRPKRQYKLQVPAPLTTFTPMNLSLSNAGPFLLKDPKYSLELTYRAYNEKGNPALMYGNGQQSIALIWGHDFSYPIAKVFGDSLYKIGFTSFEPDAAGNWLYNEGNTTASDNATGNRCYILSNGDITWNPNALADIPGSEVSGTPVNGGFIVSYWIKNGNALVNGTAPYTTGSTANGWTYCEHNIYNPTGVTVTGSGYIDELRLHPMSATMESYTYDLFKGITSGSNAAGHISRFEYDVFGRLVQVKDEQGNIVKRNTYQMQAAQ